MENSILQKFIATKDLKLNEDEITRLREVSGPLMEVKHAQGCWINFDAVWKWLEYSQLCHAKERLTKNFEEGEDFQVHVVDTKSNKEQILLTNECFDAFCMMSKRPKAKLIRKFFSFLKRFVQELKAEVDAGRITLNQGHKRKREELELRALEAQVIKEEAEATKAHAESFFSLEAQIRDRFGCDERDDIYYKDLAKNILKPRSSTQISGLIEDDKSTKNGGRGAEISIALIGAELKLNVGKKSGAIGRKMVKRWKAKHPGKTPPKRDVMYNGRPYKENTYYECDREMMEEVIREVMGV